MSIDAEVSLVCPARVSLDATQSAFLDELPSDAPSLQAELGCELERGHPGSHAALGQQADETAWWVHWTLTASEINPYRWCSVQGTPDRTSRDDKACVLFEDHPGRHSSAHTFWADDQAA